MKDESPAARFGYPDDLDIRSGLPGFCQIFRLLLELRPN